MIFLVNFSEKDIKVTFTSDCQLISCVSIYFLVSHHFY